MTQLQLPDLEKFICLLHQVQRTKRMAFRPGETEKSNTAEHTFELTLMCWYIAQVENLNLNHEKILKYALAHDIIEAYSGDTPAYDIEGQKTKVVREHAALEKIRSEYLEFPELISIIEEYESKSTPESLFVYATDKILDPLGASCDTYVSHFKQGNVTYQEMRTYKDSKIDRHSTIKKYWEMLCIKLEQNLDFYFANKKE